jgi:hypothetical protein
MGHLTSGSNPVNPGSFFVRAFRAGIKALVARLKPGREPSVDIDVKDAKHLRVRIRGR